MTLDELITAALDLDRRYRRHRRRCDAGRAATEMDGEIQMMSTGKVVTTEQYEWLKAEERRYRAALIEALDRLHQLDIALGYDAGLAREIFVHLEEHLRKALGEP